jgi:hypothetical protein
MSRILERFEAAIHTLLCDGPVKARLATAYAEHLEDLAHVELPMQGMERLGQLHAAMHSVVPAGRLSPVTASVQKMSAAEAAAHARTILDLYTGLLAMEQGTRAPTEPAGEPVAGLPRRFPTGLRR